MKPSLLVLVLGLAALWPMAASAQEPPTAPEDEPEATEPVRRVHRVWREANHGLRHGPSMELIDVAGPGGTNILVSDNRGYIYRSPDGGQTWSESRLTPDESVLFPIPLPRLDEIVLPNLDEFDGLPSVRAPGVPTPATRPGDESEGDGAEQQGGGQRSGGGLQPRDRSEDPGDLLAAFAQRDESPWINWLATCETDDLRAYAATDDGLYRSDDAGSTWIRIFVGANDLESTVLSVLCGETDPDVIYIGTMVGFFHTQDGGNSWARPRGAQGNYPVCYLEFDSNHEGGLLLGTWSGAYLTTNLEDFETVYYPEVGSNAARYVCAIDSEEHHLYLGTGDGGVVSEDEGETWAPIGSGVLHQTVIGMMWGDPRDEAHCYILTDDAFWETWDGGRTVEPLLMRQGADRLTTFALDPADPDRVYLLSAKQLLIFEPERPPAPAQPSDPVVRAAREALRRSPPAGAVIDGALRRMGLDAPTVTGMREAARRKNLLPQVSLVAGAATAPGSRSLSGLAGLFLVDDAYDTQNCRLPVQPPNCWVASQRFDLSTRDRSEPFVWGIGVLLRWNLSLAVFDRAESNSIWADVIDVRQGVMETVADYWFERQRVLSELASATHSTGERRALTLRAAEMTAALDAMTGGMITMHRSP